ncbi:hypothetical protein HN865_05185 [Candidatus Woesearchaeota archaeon]|jgi:hypothetical protein|nr:hypothetical protein [Candidatus Woesearchaeota archaeon]MBT7238211.1 hypothetical protein [Candidatus Woesearchaeota archaeon]
MVIGKKGDWDNHHGSWWYFIGGIVFLYLGLMPFLSVFPFNFDVSGSLLRIFVAVLGVMIMIESFTMDPIDKGRKVIIGLVFAIIGLYFFFMHQGATWIPFVFSLNDMVFQILLIVYATYLFFGAWRQ